MAAALWSVCEDPLSERTQTLNRLSIRQLVAMKFNDRYSWLGGSGARCLHAWAAAVIYSVFYLPSFGPHHDEVLDTLAAEGIKKPELDPALIALLTTDPKPGRASTDEPRTDGASKSTGSADGASSSARSSDGASTGVDATLKAISAVEASTFLEPALKKRKLEELYQRL